MKITRRTLALAALTSAVSRTVAPAQPPAAPQPPATAQPADLATAAKEQLQKNSAALAKIDLPIATEPAFHFRA